jgi:dolichyl-phosphate-mannose--protein O-mannosyl transferase
MDVHPPLAKLLLTLAGWLAGFDGEFDFKDIGKDYLEPGVPYVAMRLLPAVCGILLVPTMFLTLKAAGCKTITATLGSCLIIFGINHPSTHCSLLTCGRKWPPHPSSSDSPRLSTHDHDRIHRTGLHIIHEST